ncbi:hypothetical protein AYI71_08130 [Limosilactobacillus oris]|nr:hypothetical protein AYI71_08130 [Limosilactobacillus oris]
MLLFKLHNMIKQRYNKGLYSNSYSYTYKSNVPNNLSDFNMGQQKARYDYQNKKHFKIYPKSLINLLNLISNHRLNEIKEYIEGYNYESKKFKSK